MSYVAGETLLLTQVQAVTGFSSLNAVRGDKWAILNSGNSNHYAVLRKGPYVREDTTMRIKSTAYRTLIEVLQHVGDVQVTDYDALLANVDLITARIDQYRKLADTTGSLRDANITGGSEVKGIWINKGDMPAWYMAEIFVDWQEESNVTYAE